MKEYAFEKGVHPETVKRWIAARHLIASRDGDRGHWRIQADAPAHPLEDPPVSRSGVYFVSCEGFIKIGLSVDIAGRVRDLSTMNPQSLVVLGWMPLRSREAMRCERDLHAQFARFHHRGEWFIDAPELRHFIIEQTEPWEMAQPGLDGVSARMTISPSA